MLGTTNIKCQNLVHHLNSVRIPNKYAKSSCESLLLHDPLRIALRAKLGVEIRRLRNTDVRSDLFVCLFVCVLVPLFFDLSREYISWLVISVL